MRSCKDRKLAAWLRQHRNSLPAAFRMARATCSSVVRWQVKRRFVSRPSFRWDLTSATTRWKARMENSKKQVSRRQMLKAGGISVAAGALASALPAAAEVRYAGDLAILNVALG